MSDSVTKEFLEQKIREVTRRFEGLIRSSSYNGGGSGGNAAEGISSEVLIGVVDGVNKTFTTSKTYYAGSIQIYINGLREKNFTETSSTTIALDEAPLSNGFIDVVEGNYLIS